MKVGILTFHRAHNYGAVLQAYALQTHLRQMGHEVEIIDYRPAYIENAYSFWPSYEGKSMFRKIKSTIYFCLMAYKKLKRYRVFEKFIRDHFFLSKRICKAPFNENFDYDAYVIGSDQIWNPSITHGFDNVYMGAFEVKPKAKKITYAASKESESLDIPARKHFIEYLKNFEGISVRETILAQLLRPLTNKPVEAVLDPTLLLDCQNWHNMARKPKINDKYVLLYQMRDNLNSVRIANSIAKQLGAKVIQLEARLRSFSGRNSFQFSTPEEFLGWIKFSECVVTTSYHGVAFSIAFKRPFYSLKLNDGADSRTMSLLGELNLNERIVEVIDEPRFKEIDYSLAETLLLGLRKKSQLFLEKYLTEESETYV